MRITIIPEDGVVSIDGVGYNGINLSAIDPSVHAVQWYDTDGEVEIKDARGRMVENRVIDSFDEFAFVIPLWEAAKAADDLLKAEFAATVKANEDLAIQMEMQSQTQANVAAQTP